MSSVFWDISRREKVSIESCACCLFQAAFLLILSFDPENWGDMSFRNVR
jgi:hypothetical protein